MRFDLNGRFFGHSLFFNWGCSRILTNEETKKRIADAAIRDIFDKCSYEKLRKIADMVRKDGDIEAFARKQKGGWWERNIGVLMPILLTLTSILIILNLLQPLMR